MASATVRPSGSSDNDDDASRHKLPEITKATLTAKLQKDLLWAVMCNNAGPLYLVSPIVPSILALFVIVLNSIVLHTTSLDCVQPLDDYLRGNTGLSYVLVFIVANQIMGPYDFQSFQPLVILYNLWLLAAIVWSVIGFVWFGEAGPCLDTAPTVYRTSGAEVVLLFMGALVGTALQIEWFIRKGRGSPPSDLQPRKPPAGEEKKKGGSDDDEDEAEAEGGNERGEDEGLLGEGTPIAEGTGENDSG